MALPTGCHKVCRPHRKAPRKYTARDVGRIAGYAREAGETEQAICDELKGVVECCGGSSKCDCEKLQQLIELAGDVTSLLLLVMGAYGVLPRVARYLYLLKRGADGGAAGTEGLTEAEYQNILESNRHLLESQRTATALHEELVVAKDLLFITEETGPTILIKP